MVITKKEDRPDLRQLIADKLTSYDIYRQVIGGDFKFNMAMRSPLPGHRHGDKAHSLSIGASPSGRLIWKDWAADKGGGPIDLVQEIYGLTYPQALEKIAKEFGLLVNDGQQYKKIVSAYQQPVIEKIETVIHVKAGKWSKKALTYWEGYGIGLEQLKAEEVYPVDEWYLQRRRQTIEKDELVFAYRFDGDLFKIYMPEREKGEKWKTNVPCATVENLHKLNGDSKVLITKSRKDRLKLAQLIPYTVLNCQNEGVSAFTEEFRQLLHGREVIVSFDSDEAGVRNCKRICDMYNYRYVNTPRHLLQDNIKDWSDWYKAIGSDEPLIEFMKLKNVI